METKYNVVALGELLIDFSPAGMSERNTPLFACNPGGAPANVLTAVTRQGGKAAFIGKVGKDSFGDFLKQTLEENKIDAQGLRFDETVRTTLAFVTLNDDGNRSFAFFRNPGADMTLSKEEIDESLIQQAKIFHFGSLSLTHEPARSATRYAVDLARRDGCLISYDPNLRPPLWSTLEAAKENIIAFLPDADILKLSDEEFAFLTGKSDYARYAPDFAKQYGISALFITLGPNGAYYYFKEESDVLPTYATKAVDTTGAGDAFMGAILNQISSVPGGLSQINSSQMHDMVDFANASGALTASVKGAIPAIPTTDQVNNCRRTTARLSV